MEIEATPNRNGLGSKAISISFLFCNLLAVIFGVGVVVFAPPL